MAFPRYSSVYRYMFPLCKITTRSLLLSVKFPNIKVLVLGLTFLCGMVDCIDRVGITLGLQTQSCDPDLARFSTWLQVPTLLIHVAGCYGSLSLLPD